MPLAPLTARSIDLVPLLQLGAGGSWQIGLAHDRPCHLVLWVTRGQGRLLLDGHQRGFGPHSIIFIPARRLFALELGSQTYGQALRIDESVSCDLPDSAVQIRITDLQEQARLNALLEPIQREQQTNDPHAERALRNYADLVGIHLQRLRDHQPATEQATAARRLSRAYCDRLSRGENTGLNMAQHAEALGVTPTHLTRVCKQETGKTASTLLTERQLHSARCLLEQTRMPMQDIAARLGFGSPAYFTRFITQHTGEAPSNLRKRATAQANRSGPPSSKGRTAFG